jgi:hypothetical protein
MQRQVCWAHLKRDFTRIAERTGMFQSIGEGLLAEEKKLFQLWYQVRDGTSLAPPFARRFNPSRRRSTDGCKTPPARTLGLRKRPRCPKPCAHADNSWRLSRPYGRLSISSGLNPPTMGHREPYVPL